MGDYELRRGDRILGRTTSHIEAIGATEGPEQTGTAVVGAMEQANGPIRVRSLDGQVRESLTDT
jgi:hypothetical protein